MLEAHVVGSLVYLDDIVTLSKGIGRESVWVGRARQMKFDLTDVYRRTLVDVYLRYQVKVVGIREGKVECVSELATVVTVNHLYRVETRLESVAGAGRYRRFPDYGRVRGDAVVPFYVEPVGVARGRHVQCHRAYSFVAVVGKYRKRIVHGDGHRRRLVEYLCGSRCGFTMLRIVDSAHGVHTRLQVFDRIIGIREVRRSLYSRTLIPV